jgi:DNA-binding XRE family transcriptional regulator
MTAPARQQTMCNTIACSYERSWFSSGRRAAQRMQFLVLLLYLYYDLFMRRKREQPNATEADEQPLHNRVAVLRTERGLSRRDLADALGINYQTIGYIERGEYNPSLELAFRLSELFGVPIEAIFSRSPFRPMSEMIYSQVREA